MRSDRSTGAFNAHKFRSAKVHHVLDEPCRRFAEHHTAGRCNRFHPLRHADLITDRGVTEGTGADFAGNNRTGVQADTNLEVDFIATMYVWR